MSYKFNLHDEDMFKSKFNVRIHYEEDCGKFYFIFSNVNLGCNVGKEVSPEQLIKEFQNGVYIFIYIYIYLVIFIK